MTPSIAVLNQKGGVGKTTITLGLASAAWNRGLRTLVVDVDAQANATWSLGVEPVVENWGTGDALNANKVGSAKEMIVPSGWGDNVWILPGGADLTMRETDIKRADAQGRLAKALQGVAEDFDLVLIDCGPSLGLNTTNALVAATGALLVVEPTVFGLRGISPVLDLIDDVWDSHNQGLDLAGVILNRVPGVSADAEARRADLAKLVGAKAIWKPTIPLRVLINEAHADRSPIHAYGQRASELTDAFDAHLNRLLPG